MAEKGKKSQELALEKITVLQLQGVSYHITLQYLGAKYVKHDASKYRCFFELLDDAESSLEGQPSTLPNVVIGDSPDEDSALAATPAKLPKKVTGDKSYKLMITDNHTLPEANAALLGNPDGKTKSRPAFYEDKGWMKDVQPAAPFRIIVRKLYGKDGSYTQGDFDDTMKVVLDVKDPVEETDVHANNDVIKSFLKDWFTKYNKVGHEPSLGDDNALKWFKGHRTDNKVITAADLVKKMPYVEAVNPVVAMPDSQNFTALAAATAQGDTGVKLDLEVKEITQDGQTIKIGVADFSFMPLPIGGDNYRFLLTLIDDSGKDVRESKVNGADVKVLDDQKEAIPKPRAYCTGRFVIWRHVDVRLFLRANGLSKTDHTWATIKSYYEKTFTRLSEPIAKKKLQLAGWKTSLKAVFPGHDVEVNALTGVHLAQGLFPPFNKATAGTGDLTGLSKHIMDATVKALTTVGRPEFDGKTAKQRNNDLPGEGLYMFYAKSNAPKAGLLGCWMGDGRFLVCNHDDPYDLELNQTTTHEMAHGFFMRHAHTATAKRWDSTAGSWANYKIWYKPAGSAKYEIQLVDPNSNNFHVDHDQKYGFHCTMNYLEEANFCGGCALSLRFYDRAEFIKDARFNKRLLNGFFKHPTDAGNNARIVRWAKDATNEATLHETVGAMSNNRTYYLIAVGPEHSYTAAKEATKGRVNLTCADETPIDCWSTSDASVLEISIAFEKFLKVKTKSTGDATIKYEKAGKSVEVDIHVNA